MPTESTEGHEDKTAAVFDPHPGIHRLNKGIAPDEVHLQRQDAEEELRSAAADITALTPKGTRLKH